MDAFKNFELIYAMTKGGPQNATNTLVYSVYVNAFNPFVAFNLFFISL